MTAAYRMLHLVLAYEVTFTSLLFGQIDIQFNATPLPTLQSHMMAFSPEASLQLFRLINWFMTDSVRPFRMDSSYTGRLQESLTDGADPNFKYNGSTCLCEASKLGNLTAAEILLKHGASVSIKDERHGRTASYWAAIHHHSTVLKLLINHGADLNFLNIQVIFADVAGIRVHGGLARILIEHGAQVNTMYEAQPLLTLLLNRVSSTVEYLNAVLDAGASPFYYSVVVIDAMYAHIDYKRRSFLRHLASGGFKISLKKMQRLEDQYEQAMTHTGGTKSLHAEQFPETKVLETYLDDCRTTVHTLKLHCRLRIRHELAFSPARVHIRQKIEQLHLPSIVKTYLKLDEQVTVRE